MIYIFILIILCIVLYGIFYPRTNTIYKDKDGNKILVLKVVKTCVVVQFVEYNESTQKPYAITGPQNISLWEFIWNYDLWIML